MTIRNTATDDPLSHLLTASSPGGIERQEALGQQQLARSLQLPTDGLSDMPSDLGIVVVGPSSGDPIFSDVSLPDGWKVQPTDHSMWSDLRDADGRTRARIFYKAAFYDRRAFIRWEALPEPTDR